MPRHRPPRHRPPRLRRSISSSSNTTGVRLHLSSHTPRPCPPRPNLSSHRPHPSNLLRHPSRILPPRRLRATPQVLTRDQLSLRLRQCPKPHSRRRRSNRLRPLSRPSLPPLPLRPSPSPVMPLSLLLQRKARSPHPQPRLRRPSQGRSRRPQPHRDSSSPGQCRHCPRPRHNLRPPNPKTSPPRITQVRRPSGRKCLRRQCNRATTCLPRPRDPHPWDPPDRYSSHHLLSRACRRDTPLSRTEPMGR